MDMGVTSFATLGLEIPMPDTALTTDTAGVKIPSAIVKLVPKRHFKVHQSEENRKQKTY
jgi:hypothetical protein